MWNGQETRMVQWSSFPMRQNKGNKISQSRPPSKMGKSRQKTPAKNVNGKFS